MPSATCRRCDHAHAACAVGDLPPIEERPSTVRKRLPLPDHLPRDETVHVAPDADGCSACGVTMGKLGEDVTEVLETLPRRAPCPSQAGLRALRRDQPGTVAIPADPARSAGPSLLVDKI